MLPLGLAVEGLGVVYIFVGMRISVKLAQLKLHLPTTEVAIAEFRHISHGEHSPHKHLMLEGSFQY